MSDSKMLGRLLRAVNREGSMSAAITSLELKRPLDPAFRKHAERTWEKVQALARALFATV